MSKYTLSPVENLDEWLQLVEHSPQGTIFSHPVYLDAAGRKYALYFVYKGNQLKAGVALILTDDGKSCELDDLVIYNGILFKDEPDVLPAKSRTERFKLTEFVINELVKKYKTIEMALSPQFDDLRPFLWHNYHSNNQNEKFTLDLRYTSYLNISELSGTKHDEETELFWKLETVRRQMIRNARRKGGFLRKGSDSDLFIHFYSELMRTQGESVNKGKLGRMENIANTLLKHGCMQIYEICNDQHQVIYIVIYCMDNRRGYYLFGAGNPDPQVMEKYQGTIAHWDAFKDLAKSHNVQEVDLEGVNSPKRGWFKLGFGGDLRSYYQLYK